MDGIRAQVLASKVVAERPVIDTAQRDYMELLNANSYQKGGYVLYMLHQQLGDSAFFGGLRSYYRKYLHGNAMSDDLRAELERSSGQPLGQFFDQWLRRPGVAAPAIGWAHDPSTGVVTLLVLQDDRRGPYELTLPIVVTDASGVSQRLTVRIPAEARASVALPGTFGMTPRSINFDPDQRLLARITRL
jgi:aminopeptidase N